MQPYVNLHILYSITICTDNNSKQIIIKDVRDESAKISSSVKYEWLTLNLDTFITLLSPEMSYGWCSQESVAPLHESECLAS